MMSSCLSELRILAAACVLVVAFSPATPAGAEGLVRGWGGYITNGYAGGQSNFVKIDGADKHFAGLTTEGTVRIWGQTRDRLPQVPEGLTNVVDIAVGHKSGLLLLEDGTLMELGHYAMPMPENLTDVVAISVGRSHSIALTAHQTVHTWGDTEFTRGELDLPPGLTNVVAVAAGDRFSAAVRSDGTVVGWGHRSLYEFDLTEAGLTNIIALDLGSNGSGLALTTDRRVIAFGRNDSGQGDVPPDLTNVVAVAAGDAHHVALDEEGRVFAWGGNAQGESDVPASIRVASGIAAANGTTAVITRAPFVEGYLRPPQDEAGISYVGAGSDFVLEVLTTSPEPFDATWHLDGNPLADQTGVNLHLVNAQAADQGPYFLVVSNRFGWHEGAQYWVYVYDRAPAWEQPPSHVGAGPGTAVSLSGVARGTDPLFHQWLRHGEPIAGATNSVLHFPSVQESDGGPYQLTVSNAHGTLVSDPVYLATTLPIPVSPERPHRQVRPGWSETLAVELVSPSPMTHQWYQDDTPVPGATESSLELQDITPSDEGRYTLRVQNDNGTVLAADVQLVVLPDRDPFPTPGIVIPWRDSSPAPVDLTNAVAVASNWGNYLALRSDRTLRSWGNPNELNLHRIPEAAHSNIVDIAAHENTFAALTEAGDLVQWFSHGSVTVHTNAHLLNIAAGRDGFILGATRSGSIFQNFSPEKIPAGISNIIEVVAFGLNHRALKSDGTTVTWRPTSSGIILPGNDWMTDVRRLNSSAGLRWDGSVLVSENEPPNPRSNIVQLAKVGLYGIDAGGQVKVLGSSPFTEPPPPGLVATAVTSFSSHALAISAVPHAVVVPTTRTHFAGQPADLIAEVRSATPLQLQWFFNGSALNGETNAVLHLETPGHRQAGAYVLRMSNEAGTVSTQPAELTIVGRPEIVAQSADQSVDAGESLSLFVESLGTPEPSHQWYWEGLPILGATNQVLTFPAVQGEVAGVYSMKVSNEFGTVWSAPIAVSILDQPPKVVELNDLVLGDGADAVFVPLFTGSTPMLFEWSFEGRPGIVGREPTLRVPNAQSADNGNYTLTVHNALGSTTASAALWTTNQPPSVAFDPDWQIAWAGETVTLAPELEGTTPMVLQWYADDILIPGATNAILEVATELGRHRYTLAATNQMGGMVSTEAMILGRERPLAGRLLAWHYDTVFRSTNLVQDAALGEGHWLALREDGTVMAGGNNDHRQTDVPVNLSNVIELEAGNGFSLALTGRGEVVQWGAQAPPLPPEASLHRILSIQAGLEHAVALREDGGVIVWGRQESTDIPAGATNLVAISAGEVHTLALRDDGELFSWGYAHAPPPPPTDLTNLVAISAGNIMDAGLNDQGEIVTWGWVTAERPEGLPQPVSFGAHGGAVFEIAEDRTLAVWGDFGIGEPPVPIQLASHFETGAESGLAILPTPVVEAVPQLNRLVPENAQVAFNVTPLGTPPLEVQWLHDGSVLEGATGPSLILESMTESLAGDYVAVVTNPHGTIESPVFHLALATPPVILMEPADQLVLRGTDINLAVQGDGPGPLSYQWSLNGTNLWGATNEVLVLKTVSFLDQGAYQVALSNAFGTTTSQPAFLQVSRPATQRATLGAPTLDAAGLRFDISLQPGREYRFQSSGNLVWWTTEQVVLSPEDLVEIVVPLQPGQTRFFRLISP